VENSKIIQKQYIGGFLRPQAVSVVLWGIVGDSDKMRWKWKGDKRLALDARVWSSFGKMYTVYQQHFHPDQDEEVRYQGKTSP
jgi:hypothetical protein